MEKFVSVCEDKIICRKNFLFILLVSFYSFIDSFNQPVIFGICSMDLQNEYQNEYKNHQQHVLLITSLFACKMWKIFRQNNSTQKTPHLIWIFGLPVAICNSTAYVVILFDSDGWYLVAILLRLLYFIPLSCFVFPFRFHPLSLNAINSCANSKRFLILLSAPLFCFSFSLLQNEFNDLLKCYENIE